MDEQFEMFKASQNGKSLPGEMHGVESGEKEAGFKNGEELGEQPVPTRPGYEEFFQASRFKKEKLVTLQLHQTMHQKLLLVKKIRGVNMTDFVENVLEEWFRRHKRELSKDLNQLKKLL